jgi:hypothetical protein
VGALTRPVAASAERARKKCYGGAVPPGGRNVDSCACKLAGASSRSVISKLFKALRLEEFKDHRYICIYLYRFIYM